MDSELKERLALTCWHPSCLSQRTPNFRFLTLWRTKPPRRSPGPSPAATTRPLHLTTAPRGPGASTFHLQQTPSEARRPHAYSSFLHREFTGLLSQEENILNSMACSAKHCLKQTKTYLVKLFFGTGFLTMLTLDEKIFIILFLHEALISPSEMLKTFVKMS